MSQHEIPIDEVQRGALEGARPSSRAVGVDPSGALLVLSVRHLSKTYDATCAVRDLSFDVRAGEILGLVGPNGSGKTTTLRSIAGVLPIETGRIEICGHDIATKEEAAKRCLTWVPDDPQPFDALTVEEHLEFTAALYGVREWEARGEELLARFELLEKRRALGGELSRGMRQKLALSCAWLAEPRLVLLDEPLSGLDPRGIRSAKQAVLELAAAGTALILSSHLLELVEALASRILILGDGRKLFDGTLAEARRSITTQEGSSLEEIFFAATDSAGPRTVSRRSDALIRGVESATSEARDGERP